MFMTKEECRKLWQARIIFAIQAIALEAAVIGFFSLLLWMDNNGYLPILQKIG